MLKSMTAYGQSIETSDQGEFDWEIRSVNHRYLDISVRLPQGLGAIESSIREATGLSLKRGKVDVTLTYTANSQRVDALDINHDLLAQLSEAIDSVQQTRIDAGRCDPLSLLQWPGVIATQRGLGEDVAATAIHTFKSALQDFLGTRLREGKQLADMLSSRNAQLAQLVDQVRAQRPLAVARHRERLLEKIN